MTGAREVTNVATQALYMMNDADVMREADAFAGRLLAASTSDDARIERAFRIALRPGAVGKRDGCGAELHRQVPSCLRRRKTAGATGAGRNLRARRRIPAGPPGRRSARRSSRAPSSGTSIERRCFHDVM